MVVTDAPACGRAKLSSLFVGLLVSGCAFQAHIDPLLLPTAPPQPFQEFTPRADATPAAVGVTAGIPRALGEAEAPSRATPAALPTVALGSGLGTMVVAGTLLWRSLAWAKSLRLGEVGCQPAKFVVGLISGIVGLLLVGLGVGVFLTGVTAASAGAPTLLGIFEGFELMVVGGIFMLGGGALLYAGYRAIKSSNCLR